MVQPVTKTLNVDLRIAVKRSLKVDMKRNIASIHSDFKDENTVS